MECMLWGSQNLVLGIAIILVQNGCTSRNTHKINYEDIFKLIDIGFDIKMKKPLYPSHWVFG